MARHKAPASPTWYRDLPQEIQDSIRNDPIVQAVFQTAIHEHWSYGHFLETALIETMKVKTVLLRQIENLQLSSISLTPISYPSLPDKSNGT